MRMHASAHVIAECRLLININTRRARCSARVRVQLLITRNLMLQYLSRMHAASWNDRTVDSRCQGQYDQKLEELQAQVHSMAGVELVAEVSSVTCGRGLPNKPHPSMCKCRSTSFSQLIPSPPSLSFSLSML